MSRENQLLEEEYFPEENYEAMRKQSSYPCTENDSRNNLERVSNAAQLAYRPVSAPAWSKHRPSHGPKTARFEKLTRWGDRNFNVQKVVTWGLVAAGAASIAGPAIITHLPH